MFGASFWDSLAAVRMIVQNMIGGSDFGTRRVLETQTPNNSRQLIRELSWLKPHHVPFVSILELFKKSFVKRSKLRLIHIMRDNFIKSVHQPFPRYQWLIKWIKTRDILVS
jgi:lysophospholipase L1-like esterase